MHFHANRTKEIFHDARQSGAALPKRVRQSGIPRRRRGACVAGALRRAGFLNEKTFLLKIPMKILTYVLAAFAVMIQAASVSLAETAKNGGEAQSSPGAEIQEHEKPLSTEEIAYLEYQEEIDREAVENARNIRVHLRDIMQVVHGISPSAAKFLAQKYMGIMLIQYVVSLLILLATFIVAKYLLRYMLTRLHGLCTRSKSDGLAGMLIAKVQTPANMFAWVIGIYFALVFLIRDEDAIALTTRAVGVLFWLSVFWTVMIICDILFSVAARKYSAKSASATVNLLDFLKRVTKCFIIMVALLSILNNCGVNVNTIIASLGIGGMALAFASQDTIANFFGSVSIIIDRPFIVGDWVKTPVCEGHIEAIGFRSTRIRTFSKTVVSIPNSTLAKEAVENFSKMPIRKVEYTIGLTYSTTPEQMDALLHSLRKAIIEIEGVDPRSGVAAEFTNFGGSSLDIVVTYYTKQIDLGYYRATIRRVNLEIMRIVAAAGLSFAFPSTSIYIESDATKK